MNSHRRQIPSTILSEILSNFPSNEPLAPKVVAAHAPERREKLEDRRRWYSRKEYPRKVAVSIVLEELIREKEHSYYKIMFGQSKASEMDVAVEDVREKEEEFRDELLPRVELAYKDRSRIGSLEIEGLRDKVKLSQDQNNDAVEDLEFSYVYYGLLDELFTRWYAAGICGMNKEEAMVAVTGQSVKNPNNSEAVEGFFGDYVSGAIEKMEVYNELPTLWPEPW